MVRFQRTLFQLTPRVFVTKAIIAVNIVIFGLMVVRGVSPMMPAVNDLLDWGANYGPKTLDGDWWRLFTSMFLHVGVIHLGVNMWVLWQIGPLVERLVGNSGFLVMYVISGVGGSLASLAWQPATTSAGASGAVFGLFGGLLGFVALSRHSIPTRLFKSLVSSALTFLVFNIVFGLSVPAIDLAAHLGGFLAGLICGLGLSQHVELEAGRRRPLRNLAVALGGAAALYGIWLLLPPPAPDIVHITHQIEAVDRKGIDTFNDTVERLEKGELTADEAADVIEQRILPPWREMVDLLNGLENIPRGEQRRFTALTRYMSLRQESWQLWVEGLRGGDRDTQRKAKDKSTAAENALQELANE